MAAFLDCGKIFHDLPARHTTFGLHFTVLSLTSPHEQSHRLSGQAPHINHIFWHFSASLRVTHLICTEPSPPCSTHRHITRLTICLLLQIFCIAAASALGFPFRSGIPYHSTTFCRLSSFRQAPLYRFYTFLDVVRKFLRAAIALRCGSKWHFLCSRAIHPRGPFCFMYLHTTLSRSSPSEMGWGGQH